MRLIIVSNRLPISAQIENEKLHVNKSPGGLASGLQTYLETALGNDENFNYLWVGWPGNVPEGKHRTELEKKLEQQKLRPVYLTREQEENYYNGFSNDTIWPLFHYFSTYATYKKEHWDSYREVNEIFCAQLEQVVKPGDVVWVHDYQLMLLPKLLRDKISVDISIGFFLHIPFPFFEMFRLLPDKWRRPILNGMLGADLIGFHTYDYTQNFHSSVQRLLGFNHDMDKILLHDRKVLIDTFPMGIDYEKFAAAAKNKRVQKENAELKKLFGDQKVVLSIDRLDYTKGISKRLQGYEKFLEDNSQWREKVVLNLIVVPSREEVGQYQEMKKQIDELVGKINGQFGNANWSPVVYQYKSFNFEQLVALYSLSDVMLVTPLRDGMNLVAKEYVASRTEQSGVLILSEMAGTAQELGEAVLVNPNHIEEISEKLKDALSMSARDQKERMQNMQFRLKSYNVVRWAEDFMEDLSEFKKEEKKEKEQKFLGATLRGSIAKVFSKSKQRLLFLDYDGTLAPFVGVPSKAQPGEEILTTLQELSGLKNTEVVIISGRDKETLNKWFQGVDVNLVAEHGIWIKKRGCGWKMIKPLKNQWKETIVPIIKTYVDRVPGSFLEEKEFALVWHYRMANPWLARMRAKELTGNLLNIVSNMDVQVVRGNKIIEIKNSGANKGDAVSEFLKDDKSQGFVFAIGDDATDEDLFRALPQKAYSVKVGVGQSSARYTFGSEKEVLAFLKQLAGGNGKNSK